MILQVINNFGISNNNILQIVLAIALFIIGISFSEFYNKKRKWVVSFERVVILNSTWYVLNLIGIITSSSLMIEIELFGFLVVSIIDVIILIVNITVGFYFIKAFYKQKNVESLKTVLIVQVFLLSVMLLLSLIIEVFTIAAVSGNEVIDIINFFVFSAILIGLLAFFIQWGDRIQLTEWRSFVFLIAIIPGLIYLSYLFYSEPKNFYGNLNAYVCFFISFIIAQIGKSISYKTIPFHDLEKMIPLEKDKILIKIEDLKVHYPLLRGILKRQLGSVKAVDGVSFDIKTGETLGLVGESGCGKTTIALTLLGLVQKTGGKILLNDEELPSEYSNKIRKKIQMVFQDPDASMNPRMKVVDIISEPLKNILGIVDKRKLRKHIMNLLNEVSLKREHLDRFPHEFSGGQKQRIVVARALVCNPELIILDEPTSALDVSVQAQILNLLRKLQETYNYGFLFITHDLSVVKHIADRVAVMYLGKFVEVGKTKQIFSNPSHPYTRALLASRSKVTYEDQQITFTLEGEVPSPIAPPPGCAFNPRCYSEYRSDECWKQSPHKIEVEEGHYIWCVNEGVLEEENKLI